MDMKKYLEIEQKINILFKGMPAKRRTAKELLKLAYQGVKSPRGGLWTIWLEAKWLGWHANKYASIWYKHARYVLQNLPELAQELGVKISGGEENGGFNLRCSCRSAEL